MAASRGLLAPTNAGFRRLTAIVRVGEEREILKSVHHEIRTLTGILKAAYNLGQSRGPPDLASWPSSHDAPSKGAHDAVSLSTKAFATLLDCLLLGILDCSYHAPQTPNTTLIMPQADSPIRLESHPNQLESHPNHWAPGRRHA